jgi:hypothetical protein
MEGDPARNRAAVRRRRASFEAEKGEELAGEGNSGCAMC